jgi:hypothetical protein
MHKKYYTGLLHFDYIFYYRIMGYTKIEIGEMISQIETQLLDVEDENIKYNLNRERNLLSERYEELI